MSIGNEAAIADGSRRLAMGILRSSQPLADFPALADDVRLLFGLARVGIAVRAGNDLQFVGVAPADTPVGCHLPLEGTLSALAIDSRTFALRSQAPPGTRVVLDDDAPWAISIPLISAGETLGVLTATADSAIDVGLQTIEALDELAAIAGLSLARTMDREAGRSQLDQLTRLQTVTSRLISQEHLLEDFRDVLLEMAQTFDFANLGLGFVSEDGIRFMIAYWPASDGRSTQIRHFSEAVGIAGRAIRTRQPQVVEDVQHDPDYHDLDSGTLQEVAVPVVSHGEVILILNAELDDRRKLTPEDLGVMQLLAQTFGVVITSERRLEQLRRRTLQLQLVEQVVALIAAKPLIRAELTAIVDAIVGAFDYDWCVIGLVNGDDIQRVAVPTRARDAELQDQLAAGSVQSEIGVVRRVASTGVPAFLRDTSVDPDYVPLVWEGGSEICLPIFVDGHVAAILNVETRPEHPLADDDFDLLAIIAKHIGMAMATEDLFMRERAARREVRRLESVDAITGLPNHIYFQERLAVAFAQAAQEMQPLTVLVIDVDHLGDVIDRFGSLGADELLIGLAARLKGELRDADLLARYAGDDFVALLPGVERVRSLEIASRLRKAAKALPFALADGNLVTVTISVGAASHPEAASDHVELLKRAETALQQAKQLGRDSVSYA